MRKQIEERLSATQPPTDLSRVTVSGPKIVLKDIADGPLIPAAVLIGLIERDDGLNVLLTRRTENLKSHPGQVSFPGGRIEVEDSSPTAAALRETEEEIGIAPEFVEVIGYLDPYFTVTGYGVAPVVAIVRQGFSLTIDPVEVHSVFEVPLAYAWDEANHTPAIREFRGHKIPVTEIVYAGERIWGATAAMLMALKDQTGF